MSDLGSSCGGDIPTSLEKKGRPLAIPLSSRTYGGYAASKKVTNYHECKSGEAMEVDWFGLTMAEVDPVRQVRLRRPVRLKIVEGGVSGGNPAQLSPASPALRFGAYITRARKWSLSVSCLQLFQSDLEAIQHKLCVAHGEAVWVRSTHCQRLYNAGRA